MIDLATERTALGRYTLVDAESGERFLRDGEAHTSLGSALGNHVRLVDPAISRFHCRIDLEPSGALLSDVGSSNGSYVNGVRVARAWLRDGSVVQIGSRQLRFVVEEGERFLPIGPESFGPLTGQATRTRRFFADLDRAASSDATLLLTGPTGTGKTVAAQAVHDESRRTAHPFEVIDLASITPTLIASELFGHEQGAFTGATRTQSGPFERAKGGTILLDEIGELALEQQASLLRVLESRCVRRVGGLTEIPVNVRIIAATHRDLREAVNEGTFRQDLFYRLAVLEVAVPGLEERAEDIPVLSAALLERMGYGPAERTIPPEIMHRLMRASWPGNVRQLRNRLERLMLFGSFEEPNDSVATHFSDARQEALVSFEKRYVSELLTAYNGDVGAAADAAGIARGYLYRLIKKIEG